MDGVAAPGACSQCGEPVQPGERFCPRCGTPLGPVTTGAPGLPVGAPTYLLPPSPRDRAVSRSRTALLLLVGAAILFWIPGIDLLAGILGLAGAILLILGREPFGPVHARSVIAALVLVLLAALASALVFVGLQTAVTADARLGADAAPKAIFVDYRNYEFATVVTAFVSGLGYVLFAFALVDRVGRIALGTALALLVFLHVALYVFLMNQLGPALAAAYSPLSSNLAPYNNLIAQVNTYGLLAAVPDLLFAGAFYLAWARIRRGEIPTPPPLIPVPAPPSPPP